MNGDPDTDKSRRKSRGKHDASLEANNVVKLSDYGLYSPALFLLLKSLPLIPSPQLYEPHSDINISRNLNRDLQTLKDEYIDRYTGGLPRDGGETSTKIPDTTAYFLTPLLCSI